MHARLLLPPLFALVAPVAALPLRRHLAALPILGLSVWAVVSAGFLRPGDARLVNRTIVADGRGAVVGGLGIENPVTGPADQGWGPGTDAIARLRDHPVTVEQIALDVHVIDRLGLADALGARFEVTRQGFIGHEKPIPAPCSTADRSRSSTTPPRYLSHRDACSRTCGARPLG